MIIFLHFYISRIVDSDTHDSEDRVFDRPTVNTTVPLQNKNYVTLYLCISTSISLLYVQLCFSRSSELSFRSIPRKKVPHTKV